MHLNKVLHGPQRTCDTSGLTGVAVYLQTVHRPMLLIVAKKIYGKNVIPISLSNLHRYSRYIQPGTSRNGKAKVQFALLSKYCVPI